MVSDFMDIVMEKKQSVLVKLYINTFLLGLTGIKSATFTVIILYIGDDKSSGYS